jgi:flagellin
MKVNTNMMAENAQRNKGITDMKQAKITEQLSSGLRINRAADDAAGLSITQKLQSQIKGLDQAVRNAQDAVSMIQTAEGALDEAHTILQRMRELGVQGANDTLSANDRTAINTELTKLQSSLDGIASNTKFNGKSLLTGNLSTTSTNTLSVDANVTVGLVDVAGAAAGTTFTFSATADQTMVLAGGGVTQQITVRAMEAGDVQILNFDKLGIKIALTASGAVDGTGIAGDMDSSDSIVTDAGNASATFLVGYESGVQLSVNFSNMNSTALGLTGKLDVSTHANAETMMDALDIAITTVSTQRTTLGANQNELEHDIANLGVASENTLQAKSNILDLDVAKAMVTMTRLGILQQMGTAVLAQANQGPQSVLQLLR